MKAAQIRCLNNNSSPTKRVLFLGCGQSHTNLISTLVRHNCSVDQTEDLIDGDGNYDLVVSFGYRHILKKRVIDNLGCPIFNLHISYLPFNRGAHPNFWSFYENTPSGVTIHLIDEGVDTGPIVYQRYVNFENDEKTFAKTYERLIDEIESLFEDEAENILFDKWESKPQRGKGSVHFVRDLPIQFAGWNSIIDDELRRLNNLGLSQNDK
jgi:methionyl-tRNA formyltransferase